MSFEKVFEFTAAVRGFHYYRKFWKPKSSQNLHCFYEPDNPFDQFAIKVCEEEEKKIPVGHLPREISRATKFLMDRGASIKVILTSDHYRRSPLVQGGMEIACKVIAFMPATCINLALMGKYKQLIEDSYTEPQKEEILGSYLNRIEEEEEYHPQHTTKRKSVKRKEVATKAEAKDIRKFFAPVSTVSSTKRCKSKTCKNDVIELD